MLDASTLVKVVLDDGPSPSVEAAQAIYPLLAERGLQAPALLAWEVGNVVHRKYAGRIGRSFEERAALVASLLAPIELLPADEAMVRRTGQLAEEHGLTFYDAAYLEAAGRREDGLLVTEDGKLLRIAARVLGKDRAFDAVALHRRMG